MSACSSTSCPIGFQAVTYSNGGFLSGSYRSFLEIASFVVFFVGVTLNTLILIIVVSAYRTLDILDGFFINLIVGELVASFGLSLVMFNQYASSLPPIGDVGCSFVTWLDVTSVAITITSIIAITLALYEKLFYGDSRKLSRWKFACCIVITWLVAGLPGIPYLSSAKMSTHQYCTIENWSHKSEVLYISMMFLFEIFLPLCLLVYLLVRMCVALKHTSEERDIIANDDMENMGTEESVLFSRANYERVVIRKKVIFIVIIIVVFYIFLTSSSFITLSIELNIANIYSDWLKYTKLRELASLILCLKCIFIPFIYILYYDKFRNRVRNICCKENSQYTTLRYHENQETRHLITVV